ncbi:MAG: hypothetical protein LJE63_15100 [Desulfobacteraceae bacterium]|jgi:hypothetical protein|nr:hypothetical protein [Desulfobacteraceae bacterium]
MSKCSFLLRKLKALAVRWRARLKFGSSRPGCDAPPDPGRYREPAPERATVAFAIPNAPQPTLPGLNNSGSHSLQLKGLTLGLQMPPDAAFDPLSHYLFGQGNSPAEIARLPQVLNRDRVILEIGCGSCEVAWQIALKNPDIGVVATDLYPWETPAEEGSFYQKVAAAWRAGSLPAQQDPPPNLVILRAESEILRLLPEGAIDTLLLINPEPLMGKAFIDFLVENDLLGKIRPGRKQIVIIPYCREMGVMACGGNEFQHADDWSRGLDYVMGGRLRFKRGDRLQWGVDLHRTSPYSRNSTQGGVFICGGCRQCGGGLDLAAARAVLCSRCLAAEVENPALGGAAKKKVTG